MADIRANAVTLVKTIRESAAEYQAPSGSDKKCPMCGRAIFLVKHKKGEKWICSDKRCGYEMDERADDSGYGRRSRGEMRMNRKLINQYSDTSKAVTSLGDLLRNAMEKKKD